MLSYKNLYNPVVVWGAVQAPGTKGNKKHTVDYT